MENRLFKELEWGINLSTNTIFLTYDIDVDALYHICTRMDALKKYNKGKDRDEIRIRVKWIQTQ